MALGPSRALKLSLQAIMAASAGRTVLVLAQTLPQKVLSWNVFTVSCLRPEEALRS